MKNKIAKWLITAILIPLFRELLKEFGKSLLKYLLDLFKQSMQKWKTKEQEAATTEESKEIIIKKWDDRMAEVDKMKENVDNNIDRIVKEALKNSEGNIKAIENRTEDPKQLESKNPENKK